MLHDDPNESSAVYLLTSDNKHAVCGTDVSPHQLLCRKYQRHFFFVEETFDHGPGNEIVMFHQCSFLNINADNGTQNKCVQILFVNNPSNFFNTQGRTNIQIKYGNNKIIIK